jgi:hypothetical protein
MDIHLLCAVTGVDVMESKNVHDMVPVNKEKLVL